MIEFPATYIDGVKNDCFALAADVKRLLSNGKVVTIPAGFETDFASIPRLFWVIYPAQWKPYRDASLVHDYLYMTPDTGVTRAFADYEFRVRLIRSGAWLSTAWLFWAMVRIFGSTNWKKYRNEKIEL